MRALLDVNVWVALFDDAHQFSTRANTFIETRGVKIATCPLVHRGGCLTAFDQAIGLASVHGATARHMKQL